MLEFKYFSVIRGGTDRILITNEKVYNSYPYHKMWWNILGLNEISIGVYIYVRSPIFGIVSLKTFKPFYESKYNER